MYQANTPKATHLDLSCNNIRTLPITFSSLTHLIKIDLSKNKLVELPHNFGNLSNLQQLDLYGNQLVHLPVSFFRLKYLRWLDLKDNPLDPKLKQIAGNCLDTKECRDCAKNVVTFMQGVDSELERQKQIILKEERLRLEAEAVKEAEELKKKRMQKKAEREKRKTEAVARAGESKSTQATSKGKNKSKHENSVKDDNEEILVVTKHNSYLKSCFFFLLTVLVLTVCTVISVVTLNKTHQIQSVADLIPVLKESLIEIQETTLVWWNAFALPYLRSWNVTLQDSLQSIVGL